MKRYEKKIAIVIILILIFNIIIISPTISSAKDENCLKLADKLNVSLDKVFSFTYGEKLNTKTVNDKNIYVINEKKQKQSIYISISNNKKTIYIKPQNKYLQGSTYYLYVTSKLRYVSGKSIGSGFSFKFTTAKGLVKNSVNLPVIGTYENFAKLVQKSNESPYWKQRAINNTDKVQTNKTTTTDEKSTADYSSTNTQVNGVDEGDIVKTDGKYIYKLDNDKVYIVKAYPATEMELINTINFDNNNKINISNNSFKGSEMYIDKNTMVIVGSIYYKKTYTIGKDLPDYKYSYYPVNVSTKMIAYDITDIKSPKVIKEVEVEGSYIASRRIGNDLYFISNKNFYKGYNEALPNKADVLPYYKDSAEKNDFNSIKIGYDKIKYFPESIEQNFMMVTGVDLDKPEQKANISTYLGSGDNVYASLNNMYIAVTKYDDINISKDNTCIYKFSINNGEAKCEYKGIVPGTILNKFSMDENNGYFRIATTSGSNLSQNNIYVLDENMSLKGKIENVASGEKIKSVRFMGQKAYMVTFVTTDPLFVIDLSNPNEPKILGELKLPGYSEYLEPYDENHIIGFGKDAVLSSDIDEKGNGGTVIAYPTSLKISMFDVSDIKNPKEMFSEHIGDRGTYSEVLNNEKALLFNKEKNILALPISLCKYKDNDERFYPNSKIPAYASICFQGAYVYSIDMAKGFILRGTITHKIDESYKSGNQSKNIRRILYIGDTLYTISADIIKASNISDLKEAKEIEINQNEPKDNIRPY